MRTQLQILLRHLQSRLSGRIRFFESICKNYLRGKTRTVFLNFIKKEYPEKYDSLLALFKSGGADKLYKDKLYNETINPLRTKYGISSSYTKPMKEKLK